jgi:hypothetical protein
VREKLTLPLAAVAASLLVPALVIAFFGSPAGDSHAIYVFHFFVVIVTTALAAAAAAWLTAIGARRMDARAALVGTAFTATMSCSMPPIASSRRRCAGSPSTSPTWLARELGVPARVRQLIRHHHERLDGTGYPDGKVSEQLDLDVRILAACDVYDALISKRVYRDAWSPAQALRMLKAEEGTAFDGLRGGARAHPYHE